MRTPLARIIALTLLAALFAGLLAACGGDDDEPDELTILAHDSFAFLDEVVEAFEAEHEVTVTVLQGGDANQVLNTALLNAGNPEADLIFGIDNLGFVQARDADLLREFDAERRDDIPQDIRDQFDDSKLVTPIDYGYVNLNFDPTQGDPPATLEDLTTEAWKDRVVVEDPTTSSPGLQFLVTTIAHFGEDGWQDYWRALKDNGVLVTDGWTDAYYTHFSHYGGDRPVVVSYTTSPAAEFFFADPQPDEPPTLNVQPAPLFRQVETAAILRGAAAPNLAGEFIDFMLSDRFQAQIPETMFVYPVIPGVETPDWFVFADIEVQAADLTIESEEQLNTWKEQWTQIMRR
jgi:thiamine transport system substrate-binding protein